MVCRSFCRSVSPANMAETIKLPFAFWTWVGPMNHVLNDVQMPTWEGPILRGKQANHCIIRSYRTAEENSGIFCLIQMCYRPSARAYGQYTYQMSLTNPQCITANMLQTNKVEFRCDKLVIELSSQGFASKVANF